MFREATKAANCIKVAIGVMVGKSELVAFWFTKRAPRVDKRVIGDRSRRTEQKSIRKVSKRTRVIISESLGGQGGNFHDRPKIGSRNGSFDGLPFAKLNRMVYFKRSCEKDHRDMREIV